MSKAPMRLGKLNLDDEKMVQFLFETRRHPEVCRFLIGEPPPSLEIHKAWLSANIPHKRAVLIFDIDDTHVGYGHSYNYDKEKKTLEAGFVIHPDFQNKGYGKLLVSAFLFFLKQEYPGYKVILKIKDNNARALHVYEQLKFVRTSQEDGIVTMEKAP